MKVLRILTSAFLLLFTSCLFGQINFDGSLADPDEAYLESKQYKRIFDQGEKRNAAGHQSMDWARWEAWEKLQAADRGRSLQPEPWQNHGPDTVSGRIISIAFHPTDPNTFLAGSASGGLWRTQDYGETWTPLTDDVPTMGIGAVAYNPQNPNSILIATGEGYGFGGEFTSGFGILISHDGGATWTLTNVQAEQGQSFAGMDIIWHPADTTKVSVGTSFGVYYSSDGGENYTYVLDRLPSRIMADPLNPDRLYLTARYYTDDFPGGLYISDDAGASWTLNPGGPTSGLPAGNAFGYASIAVHSVYNHIVYLAVGQSSVFGSGPMEGLYKSSDFGQTFQEIPTSVDIFCYHPPYQNICQSWFANTFLISDIDTNYVFAGGTRLRRSYDGGFFWVETDLNPTLTAYAVHPDHHQTMFHPITGDLFAINDGGINYSSDLGNNWTSISDGLITHQFYSVAFAETDPDVVIGGTQDVGTFSTTDAHGGSWDNDYSGDAFGHAIDPTNSATWYATNYLNLQRIKSVNSGATWSQINTGTSGVDQWRMPIVVSPWDNVKLLSSNDDHIYKSENGGVLWNPVSTQGRMGGFSYDAMDDELVYAYGLWTGNVYRSQDAGDSWSPMVASPGSPITDITADPLVEGRVYATVGTYATAQQVYVSHDRGLSWVPIASNLPEVPVNSIAVDPFDNDRLYVGTDLGVWVSENTGLTWEAYNDGLPVVVVDDLHFYAPDTTIRIGTYGRGYWRTKALPAPPPSGIETVNATELELDIFPNPVSETITLKVNTGFAGLAHVELRSMTGSVLQNWTANLAQGENALQFQLPKAISEGVYLLTLATEQSTGTARLTVITAR